MSNGNIFEEIKARLSILAVAEEFGLSPKRDGTGFKILSPYKDEHTPSCHLYPDSNSFYDFSSQQGGDAIELWRTLAKTDMRETLHTLAERFSLSDLLGVGNQVSAKPYYGIVRMTVDWYKEQMDDSDAFYYMFGRGVKMNELEEWEIGYAPSEESSSPLIHMLLNFYTVDQLVESGLFKANQHFIWPVMQERVIFPIYDKLKRPIALAGRDLTGEHSAKYLNTSNSPIFKKSRALYGVHLLPPTNEAVVVEGYMDAMALRQAGWSVVGTMGTALSQEQLDMLGGRRVILMMDGDSAGQTAMARQIEKLQFKNAAVVVTLPDGYDPDDFIRSGGAIGDLKDSTLPIHDWYMQWSISQIPASASLQEREERAYEILKVVASTGSENLNTQNRAALSAAMKLSLHRRTVARPLQNDPASNLTVEQAIEERCAAMFISRYGAPFEVNRYLDMIGQECAEGPITTADFHHSGRAKWFMEEYLKRVQWDVNALANVIEVDAPELQEWIISIVDPNLNAQDGLEWFLKLRHEALSRQPATEIVMERMKNLSALIKTPLAYPKHNLIYRYQPAEEEMDNVLGRVAEVASA